MKGSLRIPLCFLFVDLAYAGAPGTRDIDPRLAQRPTVAIPACNEPKPYHQNWVPGAVGFHIELRTARAEGELEAKRLALKHKFDITNRYASGNGYAIAVPWLDPEQVAALRCEQSVNSIEFILPLILAEVMPNNSLQADRER
jgi:hypothetical protein